MGEIAAIHQAFELLNITDTGGPANRTEIEQILAEASATAPSSTVSNSDGVTDIVSTTTTASPYDFALTVFNVGVAIAITLILALILAACRSILWQKLRHSKKYRRAMKRLHLDNSTSAGQNQAWSAIINRLDAERNRSPNQSVPVVQELDVSDLKAVQSGLEQDDGYRTATGSSAESAVSQIDLISTPKKPKILHINIETQAEHDQGGAVIYARSPKLIRKTNEVFFPMTEGEDDHVFLQIPNGSQTQRSTV